MRHQRWVTWGTGVLFAALIASSACTPAAAPTPTPTKAPVATAAPTQAVAKPLPEATTAAAPTASPKSAAPAKQATVRVASTGSMGAAGVYIGIEKGYFKDQGIDIQILPFQSGAAMLPPLATGDLEIATGSVNTGFLNVIDRGVALKLVATLTSNIKGFDYEWLTIRKELIDSGAVKEVKDMKGKKFVLSATKSGAEATIAFFLKQGGLTISDVELVTMGYPDMLAAYSNKAIDAAIQLEPLVTSTVEKGLAVRWPAGAPSSIYGGEYQAAGLVVSEQFSKDVDTARRWMVGYVKGLRDYNDAFVKGKDRAAVIGMITKYTSDKDQALYDKMVLPYLNPDGKVHAASMQMDLDYFKQMGYYTGNVTVQSMMDNQFVEYAVQQLGPYR